MTVFEIARKAMLAGFGVQEKVNEFVNDLVAKGEVNKSQGAKLVREWSEKAEKSSEEFNKTANEVIASAVGKMNLATRDEMEKLNRKITALTGRVKKLEASAGEETSA